jgi:integrase
MPGSVYKQCTKCMTRVKGRACARCGHGKFTWGYTLDVGKNNTGRRVQQKRSGFPTRAEAQRALHDLQASLLHGTFVPRSAVTVAEYLLDEWLVATAPPQVKYETWDDRRRNIKTYVIPRIGGVRLQELNAAHINRLYSELLRDGRVHGEGGLAPTSVRRIHGMLRKAFRDAVRWGRMTRSPTDLADPPPNKVEEAARRSSMHTWKPAELRQFLSATEDHPLHPMWFFASSTGLRRSELLGQRVPDLDLVAATATVRMTVTPGEDGYRHSDDQKTQRSARTVHLDQMTVAVLREHIESLERIRRLTGPAWNHQQLLFPRPDGTWWNPPAITLAFIRAVKRAGVPRIRLQDLRHTHASLLLAAGVNPKVVSERFGHSSVAFTLDTYAHVIPGMQPDAADLFIRLVFNGGTGHDDPEEEDGDAPPETPDQDHDETPEDEND